MFCFLFFDQLNSAEPLNAMKIEFQRARGRNNIMLQRHKVPVF